MKKDQSPLVSVPVITYNSSKTVVETLDSIYNQTYPNIELIVSDDCSTDNTVQVCRDWIESHKERFVRTELLTVEKNTGTSTNLNRAEAACQGEWVKEIAGDDLLLPNCVSDYVDYVKTNPEAVCVFGKMYFFGSTDSNYSQFEQIFDHSFFSLSPKEQLYKLVFERNYIPASTAFYNIRKLREMNLNGNDERIPLLEDWPKWIRLLQHDISFFFLDREVVAYRVGQGLSTGRTMSLNYYKSHVLFDLYYRYPIWIQEDQEMAVNRMTDCICEQFQRAVVAEKEIQRITNTKAYRIGKFLLKPFAWMRKLRS